MTKPKADYSVDVVHCYTLDREHVAMFVSWMLDRGWWFEVEFDGHSVTVKCNVEPRDVDYIVELVR